MPASLPKDTQRELKHDFARGFESFRKGAAMAIGGLVLYKDPRKQKLIVCCYSSNDFSENITRNEAQGRIDTAKEELMHLFSLFPPLRDEIGTSDVAFYFCYDTGKAGVCVATEEDNQFVYNGP